MSRAIDFKFYFNYTRVPADGLPCSAGFYASALRRSTSSYSLVASASSRRDAGATKTASTASDRYFFLLFAFFCFSSTTACAAANLEIGTRNGEALT
jgi:hypothetical protein